MAPPAARQWQLQAFSLPFRQAKDLRGYMHLDLAVCEMAYTEPWPWNQKKWEQGDSAQSTALQGP